MSVQRFGRVEVYPVERRVVVDGTPVALGARAVDVLLVLISRAGGLVTKNELLDAVWPGLVVEENNVAAQVTALRKALGSEVIATIPGYGYRFALTSDSQKPPASPRPSARRAATNIAPPTEQLIGREADLHEVRELLDEYRIVTVVGPGGVGKSRFAQEVAREVAGAFSDGAMWVDFTAVADPRRIVAAIAEGAGLKLASAECEALCLALAERNILLVLDNCEHLLEDVEPVATAIARVAGARILATSQAPLKCAAEALHRLDPLAIPDGPMTLEAARALPAIALLERRARAVDRGFAVTEGNLGEIVQLCRQLDGLPLAIEMAAARLPILGPAHLTAHLRQSLKLLRHRSADAPPRHRVMTETLEWSYSLLGDGEQRMFRRLAAFVGSFTLETPQALSDADDATAAIDEFSALVERSLVQVVGGEPPRYRLLETMRLHGREKLADLGESADAEARHLRAMLGRARHGMEELPRLSGEAWLAEFIADYDDLDAAFDRACARDDVEPAATLCALLSELDSARLSPLHSRRRKEAALRLLPISQGRARGWLLSCLTSFRQVRVPGLSPQEMAAESLRVWRELGDPDGVMVALRSLAVESACHGDGKGYEAAVREMAALEALCGPHHTHRNMIQSAFGAWVLGRGDRVRDYARALEERSIRLREPITSMQASFQQARAQIIEGSPGRAIVLLQELLEGLQRDVGVQPSERARSIQWRSNAMMTLVAALLHVGRLEEARATASRALPMALQTGYVNWILDHLALYAAVTNQHRSAAWILGYTGASYACTGEIRPPTEHRSAGRAREILRSVLDTADLDALLASGASFSESDVARIAAALVAQAAPPASRPANEAVAT